MYIIKASKENVVSFGLEREKPENAKSIENIVRNGAFALFGRNFHY